MSSFSPILNGPGEGKGGEKVNIESSLLISIGGFFLDLLYYGLYKCL